MSKLFIYCSYSIFSMIYCIGSRCHRVAALNRKVSIISMITTTYEGVHFCLSAHYVAVVLG